MKIGSVVPWFGGKRILAPKIVHELGPHVQFFDPFVGGMSVILAKPPSQKETVSDLHGDLTNLARCVQTVGMAEQLYDRLGRTIMAEGLLDDARDALDDVSSLSLIGAHWREVPESVRLDRAYWYFIASWMGRNGTAGTERIDYQIAVRWTKNGGSPTVRFRSAVESVPAWHRRLLNVVILQRDAFGFIDKFEDVEDTAIYCDPPYPAETRSNVSSAELGNRGGSGGRYLHEFKHGSHALFGGQDDHQRLADALRRYKRARIVVSTYDCPRYRELYAGWRFVDCSTLKLLSQQNGRGTRATTAPECLLVNGPEARS